MSEPTAAQQTAQATLDSVVPPAQQTLPPAAAAQQSAPANFSPADMMNAINALPERIANAVREATVPPATPPAAAAPPASAAQKVEKSPGEMTFSEWWSGK